MADLRLVLRQARWALTIVLRVREAIVFTLVFPVLLLVLFNTIFGGGDNTTRLSGRARLSSEAYFTAAMVTALLTIGVLASIGAVFPLAPLADRLQRALLGEGPLRASNLLVLAGWAVGGLIVAARRFRWEAQAA